MNLTTDPARENDERWHELTGIYVRAKDSAGSFGSFDIAELTPDSLTAWLKRDGGDNRMAENTVRVLLGRQQI